MRKPEKKKEKKQNQSQKKKNKSKVGKVRFEPKTIGAEGIAHNHYTIRSTQFE